MTSAGGLVRASSFEPKDSLLSGPAAGVVGARAAAARSRHSKVISFDMGGTSTDVARLDGDVEFVFEHRVGDAHIVAPAVAVESVAAGGGSIVWYDTSGVPGLRVGPHSAGASPGPACYGAGGPLTITDVNLLLGRLHAPRFNIPISIDAARRRAAELVATVRACTSQPVEQDELLEGIIDIADEQMAAAIRTISVQKGYDPSDYGLVAFGGAGGQHACGVADRLGIATVLIPADVGLLSAAGLAASTIERVAERQVLRELADDGEWIASLVQSLSAEAMALVAAEVANPAHVAVGRVLVSMRLKAQESALVIEAATPSKASPTRLLEAFRARYRATYGYAPPTRPIEVESVRVTARSTPVGRDAVKPPDTSSGTRPPPASAPARFGGAWAAASLRERDALAPASPVPGPALVLEDHGTTVIPPGWEAQVDDCLLYTSDAADE